jgi:hypothetical protein
MSVRSIVAVLMCGALWGCDRGEEAPAFEPWPMEDGAQAGPPLPTTMNMRLTRVIDPGGTLEIEVRGATPNQRVDLAMSEGLIRPGACPPVLQGYCLGITAGSGYRRIALFADARGVARRRVPIPEGVPGFSWVFQAVDVQRPGASAPYRLDVLTPDCELVDTAVVCTPVDTSPGDSFGNAYPVEAMSITAAFGYELSTDRTVAVSDPAAGIVYEPELRFRVGTMDGVSGLNYDFCDLVYRVAGGQPRAAWAPVGGGHLFGVDFDPNVIVRAVENCSPNLDLAEVDQFAVSVIACGTWGVTVDTQLGPDAAQFVAGVVRPYSESIGASIVHPPGCLMPGPSSEAFACGFETGPGAQLTRPLSVLTGADRFAPAPQAATHPATGMWSIGQPFYWIVQ